jgi:hypothetical protein
MCKSTVYTEKSLLENHKLRTTFKDTMLKLFMKYHKESKVIAGNKEIKDLLTDAIWAEFVDICNIKDMETAICIIFKRYEKQ